VENSRYARVFHSRQWSNYNIMEIPLNCALDVAHGRHLANTTKRSVFGGDV